jgi:hypothetical protein
MKKLIAFLFMCFMVACNAGAPNYSDDGILESVEQGLGTCNRPTGDAGDQTAPFGEYVTGIHVGAHDYELAVTTTTLAGVQSTNTITFGIGQAKIYGTGWTGYRLDTVGNFTDSNGPCHQQMLWAGMTGTQYFKCLQFSGRDSSGARYPYGGSGNTSHAAAYLFFDVFYSSIDGPDALAFLPNPLNLTSGVTKVRGYGRWDPQTLKFYYDNGSGVLGTYSVHFSGAALDNCSDPY